MFRSVRETALNWVVFPADGQSGGLLLSDSVISFCQFFSICHSVFPAVPFWLAPKPHYTHRLRANKEAFILSSIIWVHLGRYLQTWPEESPGDRVGEEEIGKKLQIKSSPTNAFFVLPSHVTSPWEATRQASIYYLEVMFCFPSYC